MLSFLPWQKPQPGIVYAAGCGAGDKLYCLPSGRAADSYSSINFLAHADDDGNADGGVDADSDIYGDHDPNGDADYYGDGYPDKFCADDYRYGHDWGDSYDPNRDGWLVANTDRDADFALGNGRSTTNQHAYRNGRIANGRFHPRGHADHPSYAHPLTHPVSHKLPKPRSTLPSALGTGAIASCVIVRP